MTTLNITSNLKAEITIFNSMVFVTTISNNIKRTTSYENIESAINNSTIKPVVNYLLSI